MDSPGRGRRRPPSPSPSLPISQKTAPPMALPKVAKLCSSFATPTADRVALPEPRYNFPQTLFRMIDCLEKTNIGAAGALLAGGFLDRRRRRLRMSGGAEKSGAMIPAFPMCFAFSPSCRSLVPIVYVLVVRPSSLTWSILPPLNIHFASFAKDDADKAR